MLNNPERAPVTILLGGDPRSTAAAIGFIRQRGFLPGDRIVHYFNVETTLRELSRVKAFEMVTNTVVEIVEGPFNPDLLDPARHYVMGFNPGREGRWEELREHLSTEDRPFQAYLPNMRSHSSSSQCRQYLRKQGVEKLRTLIEAKLEGKLIAAAWRKKTLAA